MKRLGVAMSAILFAATVMLMPAASQATVQYAGKEKKACTVCHVKLGSEELNDVGKCYAKNKHSLKGCEPKAKEEKK